MRVLFYLGDTSWSGCARAVLVAARGLSARGHQVTIACCGGGRLEALAREAGVDTISMSTSSTTMGGAFDLRRVLKEKFIEVAVVTSEHDHLVVAAAMRFAERGAVIRRIGSFESLDVQRSGRMALRITAAGLIFSTEREAEAAKPKLAGWSIPACVAPLGVDVGPYAEVTPLERRELRAPSDALLIACAYDQTGRYRIATLFRSIALLASRHASMHVVVFGPGSAEDDLRLHAAALGVNPVVTFLGEQDDELRIMRTADAGWVVSGGDAAAYSCLDFMALGIPVIADRSPLTQHYVADGITGLLLSPGDPSYTAANVAAFLTGADRRQAMGNAGRTRVQRDFSEAATIDGFEQAVKVAGDRNNWTKR